MLRKWKFAVILSDKWEARNKFSTSLHYSFWRNGQDNFSTILNCEWFSLKLPHYHCRKITFKLRFSWLLHDGSSHEHSIIGKKINMVSSYNLTASTSYFACCFFIFHVTLSVLKRRKWNLKLYILLIYLHDEILEIIYHLNLDSTPL